MDYMQKELADRYEELRKSTGLTINQFAREMDCNPKSISFYENGTRAMPREVLCKYADRFGVTTDYLLGRSSEPSPQPSAVEDLGLSTEAVKRLNEKYVAEFVNGFVESEKIPVLIKQLMDAAFQKEIAKLASKYNLREVGKEEPDLSLEELKVWCHHKGHALISEQEAIEYSILAVAKTMNSIAEDIVNHIADSLEKDIITKEAGGNG